MNQRSSRNCLLQLSKRAPELKAKEAAIFAVQTSKVDQNALDEWVKKNDILFSVGMIEDDEKKTRFTWNVQSLPWLVLTDEQHIVVAEGFGINELGDKIIRND